VQFRFWVSTSSDHSWPKMHEAVSTEISAMAPSPTRPHSEPTFKRRSGLFSIYGGIKLNGDLDNPDEVASIVGGLTTTKQTLEKLDQLGIT